jgi:hypothetical protein
MLSKKRQNFQKTEYKVNTLLTVNNSARPCPASTQKAPSSDTTSDEKTNYSPLSFSKNHAFWVIYHVFQSNH